jgi:hypothetical protein
MRSIRPAIHATTRTLAARKAIEATTWAAGTGAAASRIGIAIGALTGEPLGPLATAPGYIPLTAPIAMNDAMPGLWPDPQCGSMLVALICQKSPQVGCVFDSRFPVPDSRVEISRREMKS